MMKKVLFIVYMILIPSITHSQNKISFSETNQTDTELSRNFKNYRILQVNEDIHSITDGEIMTFSYLKEYSFVLKENRLLASDYSVNIKKDSGIESKNIYELGFDGKYYTNTNATSDNQLALTLFENLYTIFIKSKDRVFYIEPLRKFDKTASVDYYVYYEVKDIINNDSVNCPVKPKNKTNFNFNNTQTIQPNDNCKTVELNFCVDQTFYRTYTSINEAINRTLEILNLTQLDYSISNGLAYDVNFKVKSHYIITCYDCNSWPISGDISINYSGLLNNFNQLFNEGSDIRVFWQADLYPYLYNGLAENSDNINCFANPIYSTKQLCLKNFVTALGTNKTREILSHELGHNFSCDHIDSNDNIMFSGPYTGHVWHNDSKLTINNSLTLSNCYDNCMTEPCFNTHVQDVVLNINNIDNILNLNWLSEIDMEYKVRLYSYTTNTWSDYSTLIYPSSTIAFNYNPQSASCRYKIEITPVCSGTNGNSYILLFIVPQALSPSLSFQSTTQDEILCSGVHYTFSVNVLHPEYNPYFSWKINDTSVGSSVSVFGTSTLQNNDILSCRMVNSEPCVASQSVTISKTVTVLPQPCGNLSNSPFEMKDLDFFPNPVKNQLTIKSLIHIKSITLYSILGQKISERSIQNIETVLDFSSYPISTYLLKIEFENHSKIIRIIKI